MTTAPDLTGKDLYITFAGTEIDNQYVDFADDEEMGTVDVSAGADVARTFKTTLTDGTAQLTLLSQQDGTAATDPWQLMATGTEGTLIWGDEGTVAGKPKHTVWAIVTNRNKASTFDGRIEESYSFQFSGAVTDGVWP